MEFVLFYNTFLIMLGLMTILSTNPIHSILFLITTFFFSSFLFIYLGFDFLATIVLIIYVGAISVLFLFVVMMLNIRILEFNMTFVKYWWIGISHSVIFIYALINEIDALYTFFLLNKIIYVNHAELITDWSIISQFGEVLFIYFWWFSIIAIFLLLIAVIVPVVICHNKFFFYPLPTKIAKFKKKKIITNNFLLFQN